MGAALIRLQESMVMPRWQRDRRERSWSRLSSTECSRKLRTFGPVRFHLKRPGLGASLARKCAKEGCRVALLARSPDFLEVLSKELQRNGTETLAIPTDVVRCADSRRLGINKAGPI